MYCNKRAQQCLVRFDQFAGAFVSKRPVSIGRKTTLREDVKPNEQGKAFKASAQKVCHAKSQARRRH